MVQQMNTAKAKIVAMQKKGREKAETGKSKAQRGSAMLREAADRVIGRDSEKLAEALAVNGKKGQLPSIKFMYELSDSDQEADEMDGARRIQSIAMKLASAPEWAGPLAPEAEEERETP